MADRTLNSESIRQVTRTLLTTRGLDETAADDALDHELMTAVGRRDHRAFARLVERHYGWALGFADRMLGTRHEAEDLVQTAFLRVWHGAARWEPNAKFSTWLYRVLHNLCMDQLRARRAAASEPLDGADRRDTGRRSARQRRTCVEPAARCTRARGIGPASPPATGGACSLLLRGAVAGGGRGAAWGKRRRLGIAAFTRARHAEEMAARRSAIGKSPWTSIDLRSAAPPSVPSGDAGRSASSALLRSVRAIRRKAWRSSPKRAVPTSSSTRSSLRRQIRAERASSHALATACLASPWQTDCSLGSERGSRLYRRATSRCTAPLTPAPWLSSCWGRKAYRRSGCDRLAW